MQYILTDIEGTTTSVSFVYDVLFPYFTDRLESFSRTNSNNPLWRNTIAEVQKTVAKEQNIVIDEIQSMATLLEWTRLDRKHPALKLIQGLVWKKGYEEHQLKSHIYDDVPPAFERWKNEGLHIGIYSSGSVAAQKLLFLYSEKGDLSSFISDYFDTQAGSKREPDSYKNIASQLNLAPADILFLSDVEAELDAAAVAGLRTIQVVRPGTIAGKIHEVVTDFFQILVERH